MINIKQASYLIRLDDACPTMDSDKWSKIESLLNSYKIRPIVAIIPDNQSAELKKHQEDHEFWAKALNWQKQGWVIALHGYQHLFHAAIGSILPMYKESEFTGLSLNQQQLMIKEANRLLLMHGLKPSVWVAPKHTFDRNTIEALRLETDIRIISDGISFFPFKEQGFLWIPQQLWSCRWFPFGVWTICLHPNSMEEGDFLNVESFLKSYAPLVIGLDEVKHCCAEKRWIDYLFSFYFRILFSCKKWRPCDPFGKKD